MNTFILAFHPRGRSLVEHFAVSGFEVWTANLRFQGGSVAYGPGGRVGLREWARHDLPKVVDLVASETGSTANRVDLVGCSLGGSVVYAYLAHEAVLGRLDRIGSIVGMGAPLRWTKLHPMLRVAFASPGLASRLRISGTRQLARTALPVARRIPGLLNMYMNTKHIALENADVLTQTVDDPHPHLNTQIAQWAKNRDLRVDGLDITTAFGEVDRPLLAVFANKDGIVPPSVARTALEAIGSDDAMAHEVGDDEVWFAHADMFINDHAEVRVFEPIVKWLKTRN